MIRALIALRTRQLGIQDLSFNTEQIATLFGEAGLDNLPPGASDKILEQSEGWPAAVRLMQILRSTKPPSAGDFDSLPWEGERQLDSLFDSLMTRLSDDLKRFLIEISAFPSFSLDLITWATQSKLAGPFLRYLVENKVLIVSLDQRGEWYRFHTLFRRYLIRIADMELSAERSSGVKRLGAQWLERAGKIEASLDLAIDIGDKAISVRLLEKLSWTLVRSRGHLPMFIDWAERVAALDCEFGDEASFWYAWALIFERRYESASRAIAKLMERLERTDRQASSRLFHAKARLAQIVLKLHMDDLKSIQTLAPPWLADDVGVDAFEKGAAAGAFALALLADHQFSAARSAARTSLSAVAPTSSLYGRAWASNISAAIAVSSCNADRVEEALLTLEGQIRDDLASDTIIAAVTSVVRARALYDRGDVSKAVELTIQRLPTAQTCGMLDFVWLAFEVLVPVAIMMPERGISISDLRQIAAEYPKRLSIMLDLTLIRIHCNVGHFIEAQELGERVGIWSANGCFTMPADFNLESERAATNLAGIALMTAYGDLKAASDLIEHELRQARARSRRGAIVELHLAQAAVQVKSGQQRLATRAFSRALHMAAECRTIRPFFEQRTLVLHLQAATRLKELGLAMDGARKILDEVSRAVGSLPPSGGADSLAMTADPLTKRELELLRMLESGLDNAQIADASGISVRTVKWHLRNLYGKLEVKNRTSAIARARHLQLL